MPPTVVLIRHAQAEHNPPLTDLGFGAQCQELSAFLQDELPLASQVELIVVSPLRRTLQTMEQSLDWMIKKGIPVILKAEWQENSEKPCDTGTPVSIMEKEWPQFNWSTVDPLYPSKTGLYAHSKEDISRRGATVREWLRNRPEKVIAVVSHAGFLRVGVSHRRYENADFRIFDFAEEATEAGGKLVEWEMTESKGGGLGKSPKGIFPFLDEYDAYIPNSVERGPNEVVDETPNPQVH